MERTVQHPDAEAVRAGLVPQDLIALFDLPPKEEDRAGSSPQPFPLAEARQAHDRLGKGGVIAEIVLEVSSIG
jgi:hypothetical protein